MKFASALRPMPALHLLHVFPTFAMGGVQQRIIKVATGLRGKYRHTVIALDGDFGAAAGLGGDPLFSFETLPMVKSRLISVTNLVRAHAALRRLRPDLLLTYNWGATEWALASRSAAVCPHLHLESGFGPDEAPERQLRRRVTTRRLLLAQCDRIVVPSHVLHNVAVRVWRMPNEKVIYLPNGVDCCRFSGSPDEALLAALAIPRDAAVVGTVAALRPEKNLLRLLRVFGALPEELNVRLVIVGDGGERAALSKAAADLGIASRIVFAGALAEPERILRRFDVFALTSDTEQMPNSVLEAMAASRAIVATDVGDVKQMLSPANAEFVVPPQDEAAFARHLRDLLADREVRIRLGAANRERVVHEYGLERMVERYDDVFAEVLGRPQMVVGNLK